jgi:hypothetical protein
MSRLLGNLQRTLPVGGSRGIRIALCVAAFATTWLTVYSLAQKPTGGDTPSIVATAMVRLPRPVADWIATPHAQSRASSLVPAIRGDITSPASLARAMDRMKSPGGSPTNRLGDATTSSPPKIVLEDLTVTCEEDAPPWTYRVSIAYAGGDAEFSARLVNALAEQYADDCRDGLQRELRHAAEEARQATATAREEYARLKAESDALSQRYRRSEEARTRAAPKPTPPPPMADNPDWIERNRELVQLQRQRRDLLVDRTPLHPEVQSIEAQIARAEQELGAIPRQVPVEATPPADPPGEPSGAVGGPEAMAAGGTPAPEQSAQWVETLHAQRRQLQAAGEKVDRLAAQERQASEAALRLPRIETQSAVVPEAVPGPGRSAIWPVWALLAALATAVGAAMISHGVAIDPPLRSPAEVRANLPIPVVAVFRAEAADRAAQGIGRLSKSPHRVPLRWLWIVLGASGIVVSLLVVLRVGGWL